MRPALLLSTLLLGGCVYFNTLYNARSYFREGDRARLAGQPAAATEAYGIALGKAAESFRRDSLGAWAHTALLLVGESHFRLGALAESRAALERVASETGDPELRAEAQLFLGAVAASSGEPGTALDLLNGALRDLRHGDLRGEGHMWRARVLLAQGRTDQGWWDLERAVEEDPDLHVPAQLERVAWALARDDRARATQGARAILEDPEAGAWADSLSVLVRAAARAWSPEVAAGLLAPARSAQWGPGPRDRLLLQRIGLLLASGDTLAAETELGWVAQGAGPGAVPARLALSSIRLGRVSDPVEVDQVRRVLLPVATDSSVVQELETLRVLELLADPTTRDFATTFAAAELAREELGAPLLAGTLFQEAALDPTGGPWRGKAVLAAVAVGLDSEALETLRLELLRDRDPYLAGARNRYLPTDTLAWLDAVLQQRLDSARAWAHDEARRRDVLVRSRVGRN